MNIFPTGYIQVRTFLYYRPPPISTLKYTIFNTPPCIRTISYLCSWRLATAGYLRKPRRLYFCYVGKIPLHTITRFNLKQCYVMKGPWPLELRRFCRCPAHGREALLTLIFQKNQRTISDPTGRGRSQDSSPSITSSQAVLSPLKK